MVRRLLATAVALAALAAPAACGASSPRPTTSGTATAPHPTAAPGTSTPTTVAAPRPAAVGLTAVASCPQPWLPVHTELSRYRSTAVSTGTAPADGPSIDVMARRYDHPDTDGNGIPDAENVDGQAVVVTRTSGELTLAQPGAVVGAPGGTTWIGDLDGDGHDEVPVFATGGRHGGSYDLYLVPGRIPDGTHDPHAVGVELPFGTLDGTFFGVGDVNGDGADDVAIATNGPGGIPTAGIYSGRDLMAPGPGRVLTALPAPIASFPSDADGALQLAPGTAPVFTRTSPTGTPGSSQLEVTLSTEPAVTLRTAGIDPGSLGFGADGTVSGHLSGADRIVTYTWSGGRSGTAATWTWDLDHPCPGS